MAMTAPRVSMAGLDGLGGARGGLILSSTLSLLMYGMLITMASMLRAWLSRRLPPAFCTGGAAVATAGGGGGASITGLALPVPVSVSCEADSCVCRGGRRRESSKPDPRREVGGWWKEELDERDGGGPIDGPDRVRIDGPGKALPGPWLYDGDATVGPLSDEW